MWHLASEPYQTWILHLIHIAWYTWFIPTLSLHAICTSHECECLWLVASSMRVMHKSGWLLWPQPTKHRNVGGFSQSPHSIYKPTLPWNSWSSNSIKCKVSGFCVLHFIFNHEKPPNAQSCSFGRYVQMVKWKQIWTHCPWSLHWI